MLLVEFAQLQADSADLQLQSEVLLLVLAKACFDVVTAAIVMGQTHVLTALPRFHTRCSRHMRTA